MNELFETGKFCLDDEVKYNVLFAFHSTKFNKDYLVYTDESEDSDGNINVFTSSYNPNSFELELFEITNDEEWKMIDKKIDDEFSKYDLINGGENYE